MNLSERVLNIKPSATLGVVNKVNELREKGENIISFGAGEPDFDTPEPIKKKAFEAIKEGKTNYTSVSGIKELKNAIIDKLKKDNNLEYKKENIVISNGAKHSLYNVLLALLNPGDEVIVPVPYWVSYTEMIKLAEGKPVFVETKLEDGFILKAEEIEKKITTKTKAIILNTPNNPTGAVMPKEEIEKIAKLAIKNDIIVISDEIYEKLIYENVHYSIASFGEEMKKRTVVINGMSKAYAMTGWRIGYMAAPNNLAKAVSALQGHSTSNPNSIAQYASVAALEMDEEIIGNMKKEFVKRRDFMYNELSKIEKFKLAPKPKGAFYIFVNIEAFGMTSVEFCDYALEKVKVGLVPGIAFGNDKCIRLSYAYSMEEIKEGIERLKRL